MLSFSPTKPAIVACPWCHAELAEFVIFGYHDNLLAGPGPYPPELDAPYDFEAGYKVGKCPFCEKS